MRPDGDIHPQLRDSYQWYSSLFELAIGEAGMLLFQNLGFADDATTPESSGRKPKSFVYSLLPEGRVLNDLDRAHLKRIKSAALLFTLDSQCFTARDGQTIRFFAVEMKDVGRSRTEEAYGIHYLLAKCCDYASIVLFRHFGSIMLSLQLFRDDGKMAIYLSDWLDLESEDFGQIANASIALVSLDSAEECVAGFAFNVMRDYYKDVPNKLTARCSIVLAPSNSRSSDNPMYYSEEEVRDAVTAVIDAPLWEYGDDYMESKQESIEEEEDSSFNLDDIEREMEQDQTNDDDSGSNLLDVDDDDPDISHLKELDSRRIPKRILNDPIALLKWINDESSNAEHEDRDHATFKEVDWKSAIGHSAPKDGMRVIHDEHGIGVVHGHTVRLFGVDFDGTSKWFPYPHAFERGTVKLLADS